jgi:hypothetical protein
MSSGDACQLSPKPGHVVWINMTARNILPSATATEFNTSSSVALIARALLLASQEDTSRVTSFFQPVRINQFQRRIIYLRTNGLKERQLLI